jgi:thiamine-phosphate pyrophosphorylase
MLKDRSNILRVIDANRNRCTEALRVLEEAARFVLDCESLSREAKQLRHKLSAALSPLASQLPAARRIESDVGARISTASEQSRAGIDEVVRTNASRLKESLRVLEEYAKILGPEIGEALQGIRYESYSFERRLLHALSPKESLKDAVLIAIVSGADPKGAVETARLALEGGADVIEYRDKSAGDKPMLDTALELRRLTREKETILIVNDRADIAGACGADGVHVGPDDLPVAEARRLLGPDAIVGASAHSAQEGVAAEGQGADYLGVGAMFATSTKSDAVVRGIETFLEVQKAVSIPCFAIGGITPGNIAEAACAGVSRAAVASGIAMASDPKQAACTIRAALLSRGTDGQ